MRDCATILDNIAKNTSFYYASFHVVHPYIIMHSFS